MARGSQGFASCIGRTPNGKRVQVLFAALGLFGCKQDRPPRTPDIIPWQEMSVYLMAQPGMASRCTSSFRIRRWRTEEMKPPICTANAAPNRLRCDTCDLCRYTQHGRCCDALPAKTRLTS